MQDQEKNKDSQPISAARLAADKAKAEEKAGADRIATQWKRIEGEARKKWSKLTDADFTAIGGNLDKLAGRIQALYGDSRVTASQQLNEIVNTFDEESFKPQEKAGEKSKAAAPKAREMPRKPAEGTNPVSNP